MNKYLLTRRTYNLLFGWKLEIERLNGKLNAIDLFWDRGFK